MSHTPGKWSVGIRVTKNLDVVAIDGPNYAAICHVYDQCEIPDIDEPTREEFNAYLIAAAPLLLAACQLWAEALEHINLDDGEYHYHGERLAATRAAIAAALPPESEAT